MKLAIEYLAIGVFGAMGSMLRYLVATACGHWFGPAFPVGTFLINIGGTFFLGWLMTILRLRVGLSPTMQLALAVGFAGAFTTFSTFMYESWKLLETGSAIKAMANLIGSLIVGLLALRLGMELATRM